MTNRTEQPDQQPSPAARILLAAAERLDTEPEQVLTETAWSETFNRAAATVTVTDGLSIAEQDLAIDIAWNSIPHTPLGATRAEQAQQCRRVAGAI